VKPKAFRKSGHDLPALASTRPVTITPAVTPVKTGEAGGQFFYTRLDTGLRRYDGHETNFQKALRFNRIPGKNPDG